MQRNKVYSRVVRTKKCPKCLLFFFFYCCSRALNTVCCLLVALGFVVFLGREWRGGSAGVFLRGMQCKFPFRRGAGCRCCGRGWLGTGSSCGNGAPPPPLPFRRSRWQDKHFFGGGAARGCATTTVPSIYGTPVPLSEEPDHRRLFSRCKVVCCSAEFWHQRALLL